MPPPTNPTRIPTSHHAPQRQVSRCPHCTNVTSSNRAIRTEGADITPSANTRVTRTEGVSHTSSALATPVITTNSKRAVSYPYNGRRVEKRSEWDDGTMFVATPSNSAATGRLQPIPVHMTAPSWLLSRCPNHVVLPNHVVRHQYASFRLPVVRVYKAPPPPHQHWPPHPYHNKPQSMYTPPPSSPQRHYITTTRRQHGTLRAPS